MANPSKRKGTAWERRVVEFLQAHGFPHAERRAQEGSKDRGDIAGLPLVVECKNHREHDLAQWMDEGQKEAINAGTYRFAVVFPRRQKRTRDAYCLMPLWQAAELFGLLAAQEAQDARKADG